MERCPHCYQPVSTGNDLSLGLILTWCKPCGWSEVEDWPTDEAFPA